MTALEFSKIWDAPMRRDHTMYSVAFAEAHAFHVTAAQQQEHKVAYEIIREAANALAIRAEKAEDLVASLTKERDELASKYVQDMLAAEKRIDYLRTSRDNCADVLMKISMIVGGTGQIPPKVEKLKARVEELEKALRELIPVTERGGGLGQVCNGCGRNSFEFASHPETCPVEIARKALKGEKG